MGVVDRNMVCLCCCCIYKVNDKASYDLCKIPCCILCCCPRPYYGQEYTGKHIVGISGRTGGSVDQLTFHYSDGTTKSVGDPGGAPIETQTFDPAVEGHIVKVEWDPTGQLKDGGSTYLGRGYKFHLSGGRVIMIAGESSHWHQAAYSQNNPWAYTVLPPEPAYCCPGSVALPGHGNLHCSPVKEDGTPINYVLEDILFSSYNNIGYNHN